MTQGYFEVSRFHGITVALFDSHWFAHRIQETHGTRWMCTEIRLAAEELADDFVMVHNSYAATTPYRDFMAVYRSEDTEKYSFLRYLFQLEDNNIRTCEFRLETARRMLASPPVRYCVPLRCCVPLQI